MDGLRSPSLHLHLNSFSLVSTLGSYKSVKSMVELFGNPSASLETGMSINSLSGQAPPQVLANVTNAPQSLTPSKPSVNIQMLSPAFGLHRSSSQSSMASPFKRPQRPVNIGTPESVSYLSPNRSRKEHFADAMQYYDQLSVDLDCVYGTEATEHRLPPSLSSDFSLFSKSIEPLRYGEEQVHALGSMASLGSRSLAQCPAVGISDARKEAIETSTIANVSLTLPASLHSLEGLAELFSSNASSRPSSASLKFLLNDVSVDIPESNEEHSLCTVRSNGYPLTQLPYDASYDSIAPESPGDWQNVDGAAHVQQDLDPRQGTILSLRESIDDLQEKLYISDTARHILAEKMESLRVEVHTCVSFSAWSLQNERDLRAEVEERVADLQTENAGLKEDKMQMQQQLADAHPIVQAWTKNVHMFEQIEQMAENAAKRYNGAQGQLEPPSEDKSVPSAAELQLTVAQLRDALARQEAEFKMREREIICDARIRVLAVRKSIRRQRLQVVNESPRNSESPDAIRRNQPSAYPVSHNLIASESSKYAHAASTAAKNTSKSLGRRFIKVLKFIKWSGGAYLSLLGWMVILWIKAIFIILRWIASKTA